MLPCTFLYLRMDVHTFLMIDYLCILFSFVFLVMDVRKRIGSLGGGGPITKQSKELS